MSKGFNVNYTIQLIDKFSKNSKSMVGSLKSVQAAQAALTKVKNSNAFANSLNAGNKSAKSFGGAMRATANTVAQAWANMTGAANKYKSAATSAAKAGQGGQKSRYGNSLFHQDMSRITKIQAARSMTAMGSQAFGTIAGALMPSSLTQIFNSMPDLISEYEQSMVELKRSANATPGQLKNIHKLATGLSSTIGTTPKEFTDVIGIVAKTGTSLTDLVTVQKDSGQTYAETLTKFLKSDSGMDPEATGAAVENFRRLMHLTIPQTQEFMNQVASLADATAAGQADLLQTLKDSQGLYAALGMSKEQALTFSGVSAQAGVYGNQAGRLAKNMQSRLTAVAGGNATKSQKRAMDLIGLKQKPLMEAMNKSPYDAMVAVIKTIGTKHLKKAERVNVYMDLFGKEFGAKMASFGLIFEQMEGKINKALTTGAKGKVDKESAAFYNTIEGQTAALQGDIMAVAFENKDVIIGFIEGIRDLVKSATPLLRDLSNNFFNGDRKAAGKGIMAGLIGLAGLMTAFKAIEVVASFKLATAALTTFNGAILATNAAAAGGAGLGLGSKALGAGAAGAEWAGVGLGLFGAKAFAGASIFTSGVALGTGAVIALGAAILLATNHVVKLISNVDMFGSAMQDIANGTYWEHFNTGVQNIGHSFDTAISGMKTSMYSFEAYWETVVAQIQGNPAVIRVQAEQAMRELQALEALKAGMAKSVSFEVNGKLNMPSLPADIQGLAGAMVPGRGGGRAVLPGAFDGGPINIHVTSAPGLKTAVSSPNRGTNMKVTKK